MPAAAEGLAALRALAEFASGTLTDSRAVVVQAAEVAQQQGVSAPSRVRLAATFLSIVRIWQEVGRSDRFRLQPERRSASLRKSVRLRRNPQITSDRWISMLENPRYPSY